MCLPYQALWDYLSTARHLMGEVLRNEWLASALRAYWLQAIPLE